MNGVKTLKDYVLCAAVLGKTTKERVAIFWQELKNLRVRLKLSEYQPEELVSFQTVFGRLYFRDNFGDITNMVNLLYREEYKLKKLTHPGVILDVGANIGMAAVWFHHFNPDRDIYCFEPLGSNARLIRLNCSRARVLQIAVGGEQGMVHLNVDPDEVMASAIPTPWKTSDHQFSMTTLDAIAAEEPWKEVALLKMDVEGMEVEILKGATETLRKTHQVVVETHSRDLHQKTIQLLSAAGLSVHSEVRKNAATGLLFASRAKQE